jgi:hypothetical protein
MVDDMDEIMSQALEIGGAVADGINSLHAILAWIDAGAGGASPIDPTSIDAMDGLVWALREAASGRAQAGREVLTADLDRAVLLSERLRDWHASGVVPRDVAELAAGCVEALTGEDWRATGRGPHR